MQTDDESLNEDEDFEHGDASGLENGAGADMAQLEIETDDLGNALVYFFDLVNEARFPEPERFVKKSALIAKFHRDEDLLETFPLRPYKEDFDFLEPKHDEIKTIAFEGFGIGFPEDAGHAADLFLSLPAGFVKTYQHGLGMYKKYAAVIHAAQDLATIDIIVLQRQSLAPPRVDGKKLILSNGWFDATRRALERITVNYRMEAAADKKVLLHNGLLHAVNPAMFPSRPPRYRRDTVYRVVEATASTSLTAKDQSAAVELVAKHKDAIAKAQPKLAMRLRSELEFVTLSALIEKFKAMLTQQHSEAAWQAFFSESSFVLSMAFGYPVVKIGEQIAVGGTRLSGGGTKFADFAARHASSGNLAIVEIKKPTTELLTKREYRGGVYPMSAELAGGTQQVLDQRYQMQRSISLLKDNSGLRELQAYAVDCVLIAGHLSQLSEEAMLKSFEIARRSIHGVLIVTFDELLGKLEALRMALGEGLNDPSDQVAPGVVPDEGST